MRRSRPDFRKRASIVALVVAAALVAAGVVISVMSERAYQRHMLEAVTIDGHLLASLVTAGLAAKNPATAQQYLDALKADTETEAAIIYDAEGKPFASYIRAGAH